ncbi:predicted protein [Botrytis cinerea T4]|uniref:Uncharacterized protein n=1 Tax=Botryotinia fuckeliana (strain T4) TaxID=999810 RepID=G2XRP7_BOTF4|nr:predicted protein [Botrytis cinerea T4]
MMDRNGSHCAPGALALPDAPSRAQVILALVPSVYIERSTPLGIFVAVWYFFIQYD